MRAISLKTEEPKMTNKEILAKLRLVEIVEDHGLNHVLEMLADFCEARAEMNHHSITIFDTWNQARTNLMVCSEFVFRKPLTLRKEG
jgi:hypothetical protein